MLLKRYNNIDYILKLSIKRAVKLIQKAAEEEQKETALRFYLAQLPNMDEKTFMPFDQYYKNTKIDYSAIDTRSKSEIMAELLNIQKQFEGGG